ncbi:FixH family protein [Niallia sp. 01092]|uniref:FixH family protein n=1 Tax=unclassified Niallia TaxID=2837522 RepID=UPI003FD3EB98
MNKWILFMIVCLISIVLSACSLKQDIEKSYKKESPLDANILIPESFAVNKQTTIKIMITQAGKKVEHAEYVQVEIWKQDGSFRSKKESVMEEGNGLYSLKKKFDREGLHFIKVSASNGGSIIMPTKQFIVGKLTESDKKFLQKDAPKQNEHEHHHH